MPNSMADLLRPRVQGILPALSEIFGPAIRIPDGEMRLDSSKIKAKYMIS